MWQRGKRDRVNSLRNTKGELSTGHLPLIEELKRGCVGFDILGAVDT